jgi:hypothetical protein
LRARRQVKAYDDRTDHERFHSNWKKARGLYRRKDWSASIMRVATSAEIAANIFVRAYLVKAHGLPEAFVDSLLISANGIDGKVKKLVQPVCEATGKWNAMKSIVKDVEKINKLRNQIAHSGRFMNQEEANEIFVLGLKVIVVLAPQEANGLK